MGRAGTGHREHRSAAAGELGSRPSGRPRARLPGVAVLRPGSSGQRAEGRQAPQPLVAGVRSPGWGGLRGSLRPQLRVELRPGPAGARRNFRSFPRRRRGRASRGRVPGLSGLGRGGCGGSPPPSPGDAGTGRGSGAGAELGAATGARQTLGLPSVKRQVTAPGRGRARGGLELPCPRLSGPRAAPPPRQGGPGGLPGARDAAAALLGLDTFVFPVLGSGIRQRIFRFFSVRRKPAPGRRLGREVCRGWGRRGGGGRSRGELSCQTPAQRQVPARGKPRRAPPASSSSRARGGAPVEGEAEGRESIQDGKMNSGAALTWGTSPRGPAERSRGWLLG